MDAPISPPRIPARRKTGTTRYEKEVANAPRKPDDKEGKWIGPWLMGETVGKGASGRVKLAKHKRTKKIAAIKIIPKVHLSGGRGDKKADRVMQSMRREMVVMKLIHHPHIMDMYDVYEDANEIYLLLEYVSGGELFDYLVNRGKLDPHEALHYFKQIISGLDYCHRFNICHRDLKPENLLMDEQHNIKIADFGMAALQPNGGSGLLETSCGSPHYASPEIVAGKAYHGSASDIWSCGVILFALLTGRLPFDHENMTELLRRVKSGHFDIPSHVPPVARDLIRKMLVVDPDLRYTMSQVMSHSFFRCDTLRVAGPVLAPPTFNFVDPIPAPDIDDQIVENLTTLFRGTSSQDIIARLKSSSKRWEKAFYHLLKEYHERQAEEYGHGMSFMDTTGREDALVSTIRRSHQHQGPSGTLKRRGSDKEAPYSGPVRISKDFGVLKGVREVEAQLDKAKATSPPIATRAPPVASGPRRQRMVVNGPRPHSIAGTPTSSPDPSSSPFADPPPSPVPNSPPPNYSPPRKPPAKLSAIPSPNKLPAVNQRYDGAGRGNMGPTVLNSPRTGSHSPTALEVDRIASTLEASRPHSLLSQQHPSSLFSTSIETRLLEQRLRNANANALGSRLTNGDGVSHLTGLGLRLPPHASTPASSQPVALVATASKPTDAVPTSPRNIGLPASPLHAPPTLPPLPDFSKMNTRSSPLAPVRRATTDAFTPPSDPPAAALPPTSQPQLQSEGSGVYPSPPPSQVLLYEPLLQSPVFTDRFSLHLDAMLPSFKPLLADNKPASSIKEEVEGIDGDHARTEPSAITAPSARPAAKLSEQSESRSNVGHNEERLPPILSAAAAAASPERKRVATETSGPSSPVKTVRQTVVASVMEKDRLLTRAPEQQKRERVGSESTRQGSAASAEGLGVAVAKVKIADKENSPTSDRSFGSDGSRKSRPPPLDLGQSPAVKKSSRMSTFVVAPPSPMPTPMLEAAGHRWFNQIFNVKPAAYVFHSRNNCPTTRKECVNLLRGFGVSVHVDESDAYGLLKCHIDYLQEPDGKMIINKPITFRAQITPFGVASPATPLLTPRSPTFGSASPFSGNSPGCTLSLVQESGAKSTLESVALRLRQEWRLDSLLQSDSGSSSPRPSPRLPFIH